MSTLRCPYPASNAAPSAVGCGIESTSTAILPSQSWPWSLGSARTWWPAESRGANPQARTVARRGRRHGSFGMKRRTRHALIFLGVPTVLVLLTHRHKPGSDADASEPGIFAELVSISSTRSAGVSDSAYFIKSIELRPTFDLFLGAPRGLQFTRRVSSGEVLIVRWFCRIHRAPRSAADAAESRARPGGMRRRSVIVAEAAQRRRLRWRRGY
jgi:hypothetical protein